MQLLTSKVERRPSSRAAQLRRRLYPDAHLDEDRLQCAGCGRDGITALGDRIDKSVAQCEHFLSRKIQVHVGNMGPRYAIEEGAASRQVYGRIVGR